MMMGPFVFFLIVAGLSITFSLLVVFQRNVVHSAVYLVATLFLMAVLFFTLDAPMVGILQILIYAGAIVVLFLFVIMLLNPGPLEPRRVLWWALGSAGALLLIFALLPPISAPRAPGVEPAVPGGSFGSPEMLGQSLFSDFVLPFEIASVLLLVAIVGAVVLAKREV
ncbi:MAG: NADH-quinone oxidoreductase subunit J [Deltaproteobacteria bacterium]|nr:NADH-quinone oxidoreductase subunit J [Deltaproteobacteria bacterium]